MNFKDLDMIHKRHLLLNCKLVSNFLLIIAQLLDENDYLEISNLIANLNADIIALKDCEVDQLIADIQKNVDGKKMIVHVQVRRDRN